jgi:hypothetical protein
MYEMLMQSFLIQNIQEDDNYLSEDLKQNLLIMKIIFINV